MSAPSASHTTLSSLLNTDLAALNSRFEQDQEQALHLDMPDSDLQHESDNDTASQKSISLSSPSGSPPLSPSRAPDYSALFNASLRTPDLSPNTPTPSASLASNPPTTNNVTPVSLVRQSLASSLYDDKRVSTATGHTLDTTFSSEPESYTYSDDQSSFMRRLGGEDDYDDEHSTDPPESPLSSIAPSILSSNDPVLPPPLPSTELKSPTSTLAAKFIHGIKPLQSSLSQNLPSFTSTSSPPLPSSPPSTSSTTYPPTSFSQSRHDFERDSVASFGSGSTSYSKKARPESLVLQGFTGPLVLGIALVDFNHLVGPKIEYSKGDIFDDEEIANILPFLALPDGAHLSTEDYSYFHLVPSTPNPTTLFGISCNRQIKSADLVNAHPDVTRSTVQKAVVVLASKPVFGPIRDRLGVITRALFAQKDFSNLMILDDFYNSLESSLKGQLTESGLYMGTSLRELVHTFRQRTLILLKALMLQKKIMFYGHPVERLCTYQYSLCTLVPGLLQNLDDSGSPPLESRAKGLSKPTSLKTSDWKSMVTYVGLPLDLFGKDAFFQPYLPLQQLDMLKDTKSWLCGSTNSIVAQQKEIDLLVNIETGVFEFRDPKLERVAGLTAADRKWMDDIVRDVNETWVEGEDSIGRGVGERASNLQFKFKGSDDYLREKFGEYITGGLAAVKYHDFLLKGQGNGVVIADGSGDPNSAHDFNLLWISEFKKTNAYEVWQRVTDPLLFDIVEPRHPCNEKPSVVTDISLRLQEGIQDLKLDQQLAPTREAITRTFNAGSTSFLKAVEGVRGRWMQRNTSSSSGVSVHSAEDSNTSGSGVEITDSDIAGAASESPGTSPTKSRQNSEDTNPVSPSTSSFTSTLSPSLRPNGIRPLSLVGSSSLSSLQSPPTPTSATSLSVSTPSSTATSSKPPTIVFPTIAAEPVKTTLTSWGSNIGSFFSQRASRLSTYGSSVTSPRQSLGGSSPSSTPPLPSTPTPPLRHHSPVPTDAELGVDELKPRNLDEEFGVK